MNIANIVYDGNEVANHLSLELLQILTKAAAKIPLENINSLPASVFDRVRNAKRVFNWPEVQPLLSSCESQFKKSAEVSEALREKGNELYKAKNGSGSLRAYTLAIAFAPGGSLQLSMAYANRSAILLQMRKPSEALEDVNRALEINASPFPSNLREKLKERIEKCNAQIVNNHGTEEGLKASTYAEKCFQIEDPNEIVPNAEAFVEIRRSPERGRHLIVTKDVPAGTVLLVDKPFVSVLNKLLQWETEHCHNCFQRMVNGIPCGHCPFALFCGKLCREKASSGGHRFEHNYLSTLHALNSSHADIQALRILGIVGPKGLHKLFRSNELATSSGEGVGYNKNGVYDTSSYLPIFNLISHDKPYSTTDDFPTGNVLVLKAIFLKELLKRNSSFFSKPCTGEACEDFVASLILKHLESIKYNSISLSKLEGPNGMQKSVPYAAAVYSLVSLCNHSCDPNCAPVKKSKELLTSLLSLKHLKKGEELFITYKPLYTLMKTSERQNFLAENYKFICNCVPCENNWSPTTIGKLVTGNHLLLESSRCDSCKERQCHDCVLKDVGRAKDIQEVERKLFECHDLLKEENFTECLQRLPPLVDYFGRNEFHSYFPLYNIALDLFKRALVHSVSNLP